MATPRPPCRLVRRHRRRMRAEQTGIRERLPAIATTMKSDPAGLLCGWGMGCWGALAVLVSESMYKLRPNRCMPFCAKRIERYALKYLIDFPE